MKTNQGKKKVKERTACPHCGSVAGYYRRVRYSGIGKLYFSFDDDDTLLETFAHGEFYDYADWLEYKTKYCMDCHKKIRDR